MQTIFLLLSNFLNTNEYSDFKKIEKSMSKKIDDFINKYNTSYISIMNIDDYVVGKGKKSFCYFIENETKEFGKISGRTTAYQKFVIYYDKNKKDYLFGDSRIKQRKGFGGNINDIFVKVKEELIKVINASNNDDYKSIESSLLNRQFKNKIAYLYNRGKEIPIYGSDDLSSFLTIFEIPFSINESIESKRKKLYEYYDKNIRNEFKISPFIFMKFLYSSLGLRKYVRDNDNDKIKFVNSFKVNNINKYTLKEINNEKDLLDNQNHSINNKPRLYNEDNNIIKKQIGRKAEEIVYSYLLEHSKEMNISSIIKEYEIDDTKGYDISYKTNDNNEYFIEVKGSSRKLNNIAEFFLSNNEYEFMNNNKSNYFIYFLDDCYNSYEIKVIKPSEINKLQPVSYKVKFKYK